MNRIGTTRHRRYRSLGSVAVIAAVATVAGCSSDDLAERVVENQIENQLENEGGGDVDIDLGSGEFRIETEDGVVEMNTDDDGNISIQGPEGDVSIDADDGVTVIEGDDGQTRIEQGAGLPDDFPASIPLPDGFEPEFTQSVASADVTGWILGGEMAGTASEIGDGYFPSLEAAGFERLALTETPDSLIFTFDDGEWAVNGLIGADASGVTYVNLTVAQSEQ